MKTIEEAATQSYIHEVMIGGCNAGSTFGKEMFKNGVEFAQRWISVEEEIPERFEPILLKNEYGIFIGHFDGDDWINNEGEFENVTNWRPIEIK